MLYKKIVGDYCDNHIKHINTLCRRPAESPNVTVSGTLSYQWALNG